MRSFLVLVTARSFGNADNKAWDLLASHGCEVRHLKATTEESLEAQLERQIAEADGIIAGLEPYDRTLLGKAEKLKVISRYGVGYDAIDLAYAQERNIVVTITPGANADSVSDLAVALMLSAARHVPYMHQQMQNGESQRPTGVEMWRKTLGVLGTGRIGAGVVKRCSGFEMDVLCNDMYENEELKEQYGARYVDFDTLVRSCDFISIHTPLTSETSNLFNAEVFAKMKKRAVLVNTARGGIINEDDLAVALQQGQIGAAALDVTVMGTPYQGPLTDLANCILTPHAGAATYEASSNMSFMASQNLVQVLEGHLCVHEVNRPTP
ncbi:MAG: phosphoglycerate dehydrogenase [Candidatus Cloacimonetes bacterium]|nr:phosphoglycerate dehydrogenase [Candidatus Cloacimonadota bacterium]